MSETFFYPEIDQKLVKNLEIVRQLQEEHKAYWLEAPYSGETILLLQSWWHTKILTVAEQTELPDEDDDEGEFLYREIKNTFKELRTHKTSAAADGDALAYFKTSTQLLEKLVAMQERAMNLKRLGEFYQTVMGIMESTLTPEQRAAVMEKLEVAQKGEVL